MFRTSKELYPETGRHASLLIVVHITDALVAYQPEKKTMDTNNVVVSLALCVDGRIEKDNRR